MVSGSRQYLMTCPEELRITVSLNARNTHKKRVFLRKISNQPTARIVASRIRIVVKLYILRCAHAACSYSYFRLRSYSGIEDRRRLTRLRKYTRSKSGCTFSDPVTQRYPGVLGHRSCPGTGGRGSLPGGGVPGTTGIIWHITSFSLVAIMVTELAYWRHLFILSILSHKIPNAHR